MAIQTQVDKLKAGAGKWNLWRLNNPSELIDLSKANLAGANLAEADLR